MDEWKVGDRVMVAPTGRNDWTPGTVTEVDPPGLPTGVRVRFGGRRVHGCEDCFAMGSCVEPKGVILTVRTDLLGRETVVDSLTVGSLFSGIGGIDLGLERAGMRTIWQSEIEPYASRVLAHHWPEVPNLGDITTIDWSTVERPDLVCGGFPCQPVSKAGKARVFDDARWLWPEFARALRELRPRWVLIENVCRLLTVAEGRAFQAVLGDLSSLGFDARWERVSAASVGAPHLRDRLFLVGWEASSHVPDPGGVELRLFREWQLGAPQGQQDQPRQTVAGDHGQARGWDAEPPVLGVADGLPAGVVRPQYRALGNAVVPEICYRIGRMVREADDANC